MVSQMDQHYTNIGPINVVCWDRANMPLNAVKYGRMQGIFKGGRACLEVPRTCFPHLKLHPARLNRVEQVGCRAYNPIVVILFFGRLTLHSLSSLALNLFVSIMTSQLK